MVKFRGVTLLSAGAVLFTVGTVGGAYGVFSHGLSSSQAVTAGTVVIDSAGTSPIALQYPDLVPADPRADELRLRYSGTVPADLVLDVDPAGDTPFCRQRDGAWEPIPGGGLEIRVQQGEWVDYCSLFDDDRFLSLREAVDPDTDLNLQVEARLRLGSDNGYAGLVDSDQLIVDARESGHSAGFSDRLVGSIEFRTGVLAPPIPQHCLDAGLSDFDTDNTVYLTEGDDVYETGKPPTRGGGLLVFGFGGNDHIIGSNQGDCIDGGSGDDALWGANQSDVVIGGPGDDVLNGPAGEDDTKGNGRDLLYGGAGDDVIYGRNAGDSLHGEGGDDVLVGGRGTDLWDGGGEIISDVCVVVSGDGNESTDQFQDCESILNAPEGFTADDLDPALSAGL